MRGWDGNGLHPVDFVAVNTNKLENTQRQFEYIDRLCENKTCQDVCNFTLVRYFNGSFEVSTCLSDGATIIDRIHIARKTFMLHSCIGMSANWLLSSAYFYLDAVGVKICNIDKMVMSS